MTLLPSGAATRRQQAYTYYDTPRTLAGLVRMVADTRACAYFRAGVAVEDVRKGSGHLLGTGD
jgi:hypothetical protein